MSVAVMAPGPVDDLVAPTLETVNEPHALPKQASRQAKAMLKMGLKPVPDIRKVHFRHSGTGGFVVRHSQVYHYPETRTFFVLGEVQQLGKCGLPASDSAALAVTDVGLGEIFESMATARSLPDKFLRSDGLSSASVTPDRQTAYSSAGSIGMSSASTSQQRSLFAKAGRPLSESPQRSRGQETNKTRSNTVPQNGRRATYAGQKEKKSVDKKEKGKKSKAQNGNSTQNAEHAVRRNKKLTALQKQKESLEASRIALSKMYNARKKLATGSTYIGDYEFDATQKSTRSGERGGLNATSKSAAPDENDFGATKKSTRSGERGGLNATSKSAAPAAAAKNCNAAQSKKPNGLNATSKSAAADDDDDDEDLDPRVIRVVMDLGGANHKVAVGALRRNNKSMMDAVFDLVLKESP